MRMKVTHSGGMTFVVYAPTMDQLKQIAARYIFGNAPEEIKLERQLGNWYSARFISNNEDIVLEVEEG